MKLSSKTIYALRIVLYLTINRGLNSAKTVVSECKIPKSLGLRIITELVHSKILKSIPGKNGGVLLHIKPENLSLYDVIHLLENFSVKSCENNNENCFEKKEECPICSAILEIREKYILLLKKIKFDQLINKNILGEK